MLKQLMFLLNTVDVTCTKGCFFEIMTQMLLLHVCYLNLVNFCVFVKA